MDPSRKSMSLISFVQANAITTWLEKKTASIPRDTLPFHVKIFEQLFPIFLISWRQNQRAKIMLFNGRKWKKISTMKPYMSWHSSINTKWETTRIVKNIWHFFRILSVYLFLMIITGEMGQGVPVETAVAVRVPGKRRRRNGQKVIEYTFPKTEKCLKFEQMDNDGEMEMLLGKWVHVYKCFCCNLFSGTFFHEIANWKSGKIFSRLGLH